MSTNRNIKLPDGWAVNADTETHLSVIHSDTGHVVILTPTRSVTDKWRVKGLKGFDSEPGYPIFASDVAESTAIETAVEVMEAVATNGDAQSIETVDTNVDEPVAEAEDESNQSDHIEDTADSGDDGQADLSSFT